MKFRLAVLLLFLDMFTHIHAGGADAVSALPEVNVAGINLWESSSKGRGRVSFTSYIPVERKSDAAVIICPGGSYFWLDKKHEGEETALELAAHGIASFVLNYRVAGKINFITDFRLFYDGNRFPRMLEDLQAAISYVRDNASAYNINPDKIGAMGFSAGGHLVMLSAESEMLPEGLDGYHHPGAGAMPNFVVPIYPVVTMSDEKLVHKRSRRALMGIHSRKAELRDRLSLEKNVPDSCCPVFLVNCADDSVVDFRNSEILNSALDAKGVRHTYIQYPAGGHGFGTMPVAVADSSCSWTEEFYRWLSTL